MPLNVPLRAIDRATQQFISSLPPASSPELVAAVGLVSFQVGQGHSCVDLAKLPPASQVDAQALAPLYQQPWETIQPILQASPWVGVPYEANPEALFVLHGSRLYLRRYWDSEQRVIDSIRARLAAGFTPAVELRADLDQLFPASASLDWQRVACAVAAGSRFSIITGGPGTGKTTTVVKVLGLLQSQSLRATGESLQIALAAPTGKAAARLSESIGKQIDSLPIDAATRALIPSEVSTVHRLLGRRMGTRRPKYNAFEPLPVDVLVVDEASMLDLAMMADVLDALPAHAQLILLGDRDQLASVEAGSVLGDLCQNAAGARYSSATRAWIEQATGCNVVAPDSEGTALEQHVVMLRHSHRFDGSGGIGRMARLVNAGHVAKVVAQLKAGDETVQWHAETKPTAIAVAGYRDYLTLIRERRPSSVDSLHWEAWAREVLDVYGRFQILAAVREGPRGVVGLNTAITAALADAQLISPEHTWYEGRPIMVTRNDAASGLMNGDVGITLRLPGPQGSALRAVFPAAGGGIRSVAPARLASVEDAYAITVHKSQGSEFDRVCLIMPRDDTPVLTRELFYTAITRARHAFDGVGSMNLAGKAVERLTTRVSGLNLAVTSATTATKG